MLTIKSTVLSLALAGSALMANAASVERVQKILRESCEDHTPRAVEAWSNEDCILAAVAEEDEDAPVAEFLDDVWGHDAPDAVDINRPSEQVLARLSWGNVGGNINADSYTDALYASLYEIQGEDGHYPHAEDVEASWNAVAIWTGHCDGDVPPNEFADYLQYSSSVMGALGENGERACPDLEIMD